MVSKKMIIFAVILFVAAAVLLQNFAFDLIWGGVVAILAMPLAHQYARRLSNGWAIVLSLITMISVVGIPLGFLINTLSAELVQLTKYLVSANARGLEMPEALKSLPYVSEYITHWWQEHLSHPGDVAKLVSTVALMEGAGTTAGTIVGLVFSNVLHIVLAMLAALVFMFQSQYVTKTIQYCLQSIIPATHTQAIMSNTVKAIRATAFGLGSVAVLEGVVLGVAYAVAGAPYPATLGLLTVYMAMIPGGAPLSFTTVSVVLLTMGKPIAALGLFAWGSFELFMVDKFIRPKLIGNSIGLPFLAVLFGLLGGVTQFGPLGLFIGPAIMAHVFYVFSQVHQFYNNPDNPLQDQTTVIAATDAVKDPVPDTQDIDMRR